MIYKIAWTNQERKTKSIYNSAEIVQKLISGNTNTNINILRRPNE